MVLVDALAQNSWFLIATTLALGLCVGSFLNVVAYRLPLMMEREWKQECRSLLELPEEPAPEPMSLVRPASRCPSCSAPIRAWHNIPVFGWLWLRGRCASCSAPISAQYPVVEGVTGVLSAMCAWQLGWGPALAAGLVLTWVLVALTVIDLKTMLLPDSLTLPLLWIGLLLSLWGVFVSPAASIVGAAAGYLSLWLVFHAFKLVTGKEGMGYGDFKLLAALGAWFGWQSLPFIILASSFVGAIVGIGLILFRRHDRDVPIPFGPYLAAAGWITLLWGQQAIALWSRAVAP